MEAGCRDHAESGQDGGDGRSDGEAGNRQIRWRVEERTKKADPAVNGPAVAIQKPKPKGGERVEIGGGDERCDQARVDEEPVPLRSCMAMLKGWMFGSFHGRPREKQGNESKKLGARGGEREREPLPEPKKEVGSRGREGRITGERPKGAGKEYGRQRRDGEVGVEVSGGRAGECRYWAWRRRWWSRKRLQESQSREA